MRLAPWFLFLAACGFKGGAGTDGPPDGPPPLSDKEEDFSLDTAAELGSVTAGFTDTFASPAGTVEPVAFLPGSLLIEIDNGPILYDNSWATHPALSQIDRRGFMTPSFANTPPPGAGNGFASWFSGEVRMEAGAQKLAVPTGINGGLAFVDVLGRDGAVMVHCASTSAECAVTSPAAGWYPIRMGWRRLTTNTNSLQLQWAVGADPLVELDAATRLRTRVHSAELAGARVDGFDTPRSLNHVVNATALSTVQPLGLNWGPSLFGLGTGSPSYRSVAQLRITEAGSYDVGLDGNAGTSYRMWLDGEWVTAATAFNYVADNVDPPLEVVTRPLSVGWHEVVVEAFDTRGTVGTLAFTVGKAGLARAVPAATNVRPVIGKSPLVATVGNGNAIALLAGMPVSRTLTVPSLATVSPNASAVDVGLRLTPKQWTGLQVLVYPPGVTSGIPLTFDSTTLPNDQIGDIQGSLSKAALGNVPAQGDWKIEVIHPNVGGVNAGNTLASVRVNVLYPGGPGVAGTVDMIARDSTYSSMISLSGEHELHALFADLTTSTGCSATLSAQICSDASGTSCQAALTPAELAAAKPRAQFVKVSVAFTSDGLAVPALDKLTLRYLK
jgi:hypothetical protein